MPITAAVNSNFSDIFTQFGATLALCGHSFRAIVAHLVCTVGVLIWAWSVACPKPISFR
jgi:hypothetical protein